jgi:signal transduction histidine kinase
VAAIKVLLVDDDEVILALLSDFLTQEGFEITTALSAREALKFITSETYDVLLSDLNMPGPGDGLTVVSAMRHANPQTVTILLSALPRMGAATRAILRQTDEILLKPIDPAQLVAAINRRIARGPQVTQQGGEEGAVQNTPETDYILTVAHELRTPLTSIRGALGLLVDGRAGTVDAKAQRLLTIALTNADRMIRLINRQLDLGRFEAGFATLQIRRSSFSVLVRQAIEEIATTADLAQVRISVPAFAVPGQPEIFLDTDPDMILQVLTNLLANSIKFSSPGSEVVIDMEAPPTALIFRVVDQGRGIPESQLETIFERYHQVEAAGADRQLGTGLGLAICRAIVQQHGGTITAARNLTWGSTFTVTIPRTQRASDAVPT